MCNLRGPKLRYGARSVGTEEGNLDQLSPARLGSWGWEAGEAKEPEAQCGMEEEWSERQGLL